MPRVSVANPFVERVRARAGQERPRVGVGQSFESQRGQSRQRLEFLSLPLGEQEADGLVADAARDESERERGGAVQPVRVIDDAEQRLPVGGRR